MLFHPPKVKIHFIQVFILCMLGSFFQQLGCKTNTNDLGNIFFYVGDKSCIPVVAIPLRLIELFKINFLRQIWTLIPYSFSERSSTCICTRFR